MAGKNVTDGRPLPLPTNEDDDGPKLPPMRLFIVYREGHEDKMLHAHGYVTDSGVAIFFTFTVEVREELAGPMIFQYNRYSFKEWVSIEEVVEIARVEGKPC